MPCADNRARRHQLRRGHPAQEQCGHPAVEEERCELVEGQEPLAAWRSTSKGSSSQRRARRDRSHRRNRCNGCDGHRKCGGPFPATLPAGQTLRGWYWAGGTAASADSLRPAKFPSATRWPQHQRRHIIRDERRDARGRCTGDVNDPGASPGSISRLRAQRNQRDRSQRHRAQGAMDTQFGPGHADRSRQSPTLDLDTGHADRNRLDRELDRSQRDQVLTSVTQQQWPQPALGHRSLGDVRRHTTRGSAASDATCAHGAHSAIRA